MAIFSLFSNTGWGRTPSSSNSSLLLEVEVPIVSDAVCEAACSDFVNGQCVYAAFNGSISSDMVCAGSSGKGACLGDTGGPLTVKSSLNNQHDLVGVHSWGYGCRAVSIFISVSTFSFVDINFIPG